MPVTDACDPTKSPERSACVGTIRTANATLSFPSDPGNIDINITEGGISVWDGREFRSGVPGVLAGRCVGAENCEAVEITVASGTFAFEASV